MATKYEEKIRKFGYKQLRELWKKHGRDDSGDSFWAKGKLLEHVVLRAFELEAPGCATYPFSVREESKKKPIEIEQIDGAIQDLSFFGSLRILTYRR